jgi:hypothetical protein
MSVALQVTPQRDTVTDNVLVSLKLLSGMPDKHRHTVAWYM